LEGCGDAQVRSARIQELGSRLWHGLQELENVSPLLECPPPAGLVSFRIEGSVPEEVVGRLGAQAIWLRTLAHPHCLRACTHITTTEAEVERLLEALCP
ncbi:MAG: cysteine lyase, partial [Cyanobacteriota bacterium]